MRNDSGALLGACADITDYVAARDRAARRGDLLVSAGMIRMDLRVDDIANRFMGELPDRGQHSVTRGSEACIHQQHAVLAD